MAASQRTGRARPFKDQSGQTFGCVTVVRIADSVSNHRYWLCRCVCGAERIIRGDHLKRYIDRPQCQCSITGTGRVGGIKAHGLSRTREYSVWSKMLLRCYDSKNDNYRWYGGIGHYVCQRWRESVQAFIEDVGQAPSTKHTLDRIDTLKHYTCGKCDECKEKGDTANCRWATKAEQVRNMKNNLWFTHNGETLILKDWARKLGIRYHKLYLRIYRYGYSFEEAIAITEDLRRSAKHRRRLISPTG